MAQQGVHYPVPGRVFHHREGVEFPDDVDIVPTRGEGAYIWTEHGDRYLDYMMGSGPVLLGHARPEIVDVLQDRAALGTSFYKTERTGLELARRMVDAIPCADGLKFTSSGGEATYYALRLARAATGRTKTLKFQGGYHGFHDAVLRSSDKRDPKQVLDAGVPTGTVDTMGTLPGVTDETIIAPYNDIETTRTIAEQFADDLAAIIVEPIQRALPATPSFLAGLREIADDCGCALVFDEVVTGFRFAMGGAQEYYDIEADIATYGKAIGAGTPIGAVVGRDEFMRLSNPETAPDGQGAYISGTLSGNPLSVAAAHTTLDILEREDPFGALFTYGDDFRAIIDDVLEDRSIEGRAIGLGPIVDYVLNDDGADYTQWKTIATSDRALKERIDVELLDHGQLHHVGGKRYISTAHGDQELELTAEGFEAALAAVT